jgi:hypothetical protein
MRNDGYLSTKSMEMGLSFFSFFLFYRFLHCAKGRISTGIFYTMRCFFCLFRFCRVAIDFCSFVFGSGAFISALLHSLLRGFISQVFHSLLSQES